MDLSTYLNSQVQGSSTASTASTTTSTTSTNKNDLSSLDASDFMTMMLAQIKYQDPMNPTDTGQQLAQLAQLSTVTGINQMNTSLDSLVSAVNSAQVINASSLIGHQVLVNGSQIQTAAGAGIQGQMILPNGSQSVGVDIMSSAGTLVRHIDLGAQSAGPVAFAWDGTDASGNTAPAGTYTIKASYSDGTSQQAVDTQILSTVRSVTMPSSSGGSMQLQVDGLGEVNLSDLTAVG